MQEPPNEIDNKQQNVDNANQTNSDATVTQQEHQDPDLHPNNNETENSTEEMEGTSSSPLNFSCEDEKQEFLNKLIVQSKHYLIQSLNVGLEILKLQEELDTINSKINDENMELQLIESNLNCFDLLLDSIIAEYA